MLLYIILITLGDIMHIPDGYLDIHVAMTLNIISFITMIYSLKSIESKESIEKLIPKVGLVSSGIFVAQMLNWPIPGGTSAHFLGAGLASILLGPYFAILAMASVLIIQTLIFGDGGILSIGANIFNIAIVPATVAYVVMKLFKWKKVGAFFAGWLSVVVAAFFVGLETGISSSFAYNIAITIPVMVIWHGILGIIEGVITYMIYSKLGGRLI